MKTEQKIETRHHPINSTYTVGKTVVNEENQKQVVHEERQVQVAVTQVDDRLFFRGAAL